MSVLALVCARGGSKGIPWKNLRPLGGRPLIAWSIDQARSTPGVDRVIVSTDSEPLAAIARESGADVPFIRPADLARDDSPEWAVWQHALTFVRAESGRLPTVLLVVPPTAPLRHVDDLTRCLQEYNKGQADVVITVSEAHRNPFFNMVKLESDGGVSVVIPPSASVHRRQDAPAVFDMTTVAYAAKPEFVLTRGGLFEGRVRHVVVPPERALDIDTPLDLQIAECLLSAR